MTTMIATTYDAMMREAMRAFLPMWDWRWQKAQLFQESRLDPNARSGVGAMGIAQFMQFTWEDVLAGCPGLPAHATPWDPNAAIPASAWYVAKIRSWWRDIANEDDRRRFTFASYNAGFGNMGRARTLAGKSTDYWRVMAALPQITGEANAAQTRTYVERIERWHSQILELDAGRPADFSDVVAGVETTAPRLAP
jgi:membrane-bound lytic murein transglycosylase MltF